MMLSYPRMLNWFNGLPHPLHGSLAPATQQLALMEPTDTPSARQAGLAPLEPGLASKIRQASGAHPDRRAGGV